MKPTNFSILLATCHILLFIFYGLHTEWHHQTDYLIRYRYFVDVSIMLLVGFGYLMTFLRYYGVGAVGLTMLITCFGLELSLIVEQLFRQSGWSSKVKLGMSELLDGDFAVAAFLISFGGVIGKVSPKQLLILVFCETFAYCANKQLICVRWLGIADIGGSISIHMFGAYFGLAVSLVLGKPTELQKAKSSTASDVCSLIGTTFLWLYWPSFNGGAVAIGSQQAEIAIYNTFLGLVASTITTFILSPVWSYGKIRPVDVQNAALAGGVAMGAVADLDMGPVGALIIGSLGGAISTIGFNKLQPWIENRGLNDSCGIHNLHGLPSLVSGIASAIIPAVKSNLLYAGDPGNQIAAVGLTLLNSIVTGLITGALMRPFHKRAAIVADDSQYWTVADDFETHGMHYVFSRYAGSKRVDPKDSSISISGASKKYVARVTPNETVPTILEANMEVAEIK